MLLYTHWLYFLTSHSFSFFPLSHSVFNVSQSGFSSCHPSETILVRVTKHIHLAKALRSHKCGWSLLSWSPFFTWLLRLRFLLFFFFLPHWLYFCNPIGWITALCLLHPILSSQPPNVWEACLWNSSLSSLSPQVISWLLKLCVHYFQIILPAVIATLHRFVSLTTYSSCNHL